MNKIYLGAGPFNTLNWGWKHPPEISQNTKGMSMKFLPHVGNHMEAQNQKIVLTYLAWSVNYRPKSRKSSFLEMQLLRMLTLQNF